MPGLQRDVPCRLCGDLVYQAFALPDTPLANDYRDVEGIFGPKDVREVELYPLRVGVCRACAHVQLMDVVDHSGIFGNYRYASGPGMKEHFGELAVSLRAKLFDCGNRLVGLHGWNILEIGSNDGSFLRTLPGHTFNFDQVGHIVGVDPAGSTLVKERLPNSIHIEQGFFTGAKAKELEAKYGKFNAVVACNVFAHIPDLHDVFMGLETVLAPDGVLVFEVQSLQSMVEGGMFDMIYHEHLDYHTLEPLIPFLEGHGFVVERVGKVSTHGGSLRVWARYLPSTQGVSEYLKQERSSLCRDQRYLVETSSSFNPDHRRVLEALLDFKRGIDKCCEQVKNILEVASRDYNRVLIGYGSPAKATTLLYALGQPKMPYIVDDSPFKAGRYMPDGRTQIIPWATFQSWTHMKELDPSKADVLILAWNYAENILKKLEDFMKAGGRCIVPFPEVKVHTY